MFVSASITLVPLTILRRFKDPFNRVWQAASLSQLGFLMAAVFLTTAFRVYVPDEWIIVISIYSPLLISIPLRYCVDIVLPYHRRNVIYAFLHEKTISGDIIVRSLDSLIWKNRLWMVHCTVTLWNLKPIIWNFGTLFKVRVRFLLKNWKLFYCISLRYEMSGKLHLICMKTEGFHAKIRWNLPQWNAEK